MKKSIILSGLFYVFFFLVNGSAQNQPLSVDQSFSGAKKIKIDLSTGWLDIKGSTSDEVRIKGYFDDAAFKVKVAQDGEAISILEKKERHNSDDEKSRWELEIPRGMEIEANLSTGEVTISDFHGTLHGNSSTGDIVLSDCQGTISWNTGTGRFIVENCEGEFNLNSGTGDGKLRAITGEWSVNTGTGNLTLENGRGTVSANSGTGDIKASGLNLAGASSFNSGTGDVKVSLPAEATADLSLNSGTGDAVLDLGRHDLKGELTMSCNKRKGRIVAPFNFDKEWSEGSGQNETIYKSKQFGENQPKIKVGTGTGKAVVSR